MSDPGTRTASTSSSLIRRVKAGDAEAWQRLTDLYGPLVYHWCRQCGLQAPDAADIFQEVFTSVVNSVDRFQLGQRSGGFRSWLWSIARNKMRDFHRKQANREVSVGGTDAQLQMSQVPDELPDDEASEEKGPSVALYHRALESVRAEFEDRTWQAFWRVAVEGQSTADVAEDLGITTNGIRQAKSRVLRRLRQELGDA